MDSKEIAHAIITEMKASGHAFWVDPETHAADHQFMHEWRTELAERRERRKRIHDRIAGSLILSAIVGLIVLIGAGVMEWIRRHY